MEPSLNGIDMVVNQKDVELVKGMLLPGESVGVTVRQRKYAPGGALITPTSLIATSNRIIIINREDLGIRKDYEVIAYDKITSVRLEHGVISSTIFVRIAGYDTDKGLLAGTDKQEGEISGLKHKDAKDLIDYLNKKIAEANGLTAAESQVPSTAKFCSKCGARLNAGAKFCSSCGAKL